jgi:hypothetical protein
MAEGLSIAPGLWRVWPFASGPILYLPARKCKGRLLDRLPLPRDLATSLVIIRPIFDQLAVVIPDVQSEVAREQFCAPNPHGHNISKV